MHKLLLSWISQPDLLGNSCRARAGKLIINFVIIRIHPGNLDGRLDPHLDLLMLSFILSRPVFRGARGGNLFYSYSVTSIPIRPKPIPIPRNRIGIEVTLTGIGIG